MIRRLLSFTSVVGFTVAVAAGVLGCAPAPDDGAAGGRGGSGTGGTAGSGGNGGKGGGSPATGGSAGGAGSAGSAGTGGSPATGGAVGTPGTGGAASTGGSGGAGGTGGAGGSGGSGGGGGGAGSSSPVDAPLADGGAAPDAAGDAASGDSYFGNWNPPGDPVADRPWIRLCPKASSKEQCCQMLCECLPQLCSDSPADKARFGSCMSMCMGLTDYRARCQVYHCFESKNPRVPKDHVSHCGHASGRVGGGGCGPVDNQK